MAGRVLNLKDVLTEDQKACEIAKKWCLWDDGRKEWKSQVQEVRNYVYATDTTTTTNSKLPWKNKTTRPKLCHIRDNLFANYMANLFPRSRWVRWIGDTKDAAQREKVASIENYMYWVIEQGFFKREYEKLVYDYIDTGNAFVTRDWVDFRQTLPDRTQAGYVGPQPRRINPMDIVFNPTSPSFDEAPKIVRSLVTIGELKEIITRESQSDETEDAEKLFDYLFRLRVSAREAASDTWTQDDSYRMDGFTSFRHYLESDNCEILTFYGDVFDYEKNEYLRNYIIKIVDRHKVISCKPNPSASGLAPIRHVGWRVRQDNLWAMGPLANLVGMQYRLDHLENLKADCFDLIAFPPVKVKGFVEPFKWGPMERINVGDADSDVEIMTVPYQALQINNEIALLEQDMEEKAGAPKEALGFRSPGEKTAFEVDKLANAANRVFVNKTAQFEEKLTEPNLNDMLEMARRNMQAVTTIRVFDTDYKYFKFQELTVDDITGVGRIKPMAARHFAEKAHVLQGLVSLANTPWMQIIAPHLSSIKAADLIENLLDIEDYDLFSPNAAITEQAETQRLAQVTQEQMMMEQQTAAGIQPDDYDTDRDLTPPPGEEPTEEANAAPVAGMV